MRGLKLIIALLLLKGTVFSQTGPYVQPLPYRHYSLPFQINIGYGSLKKTDTSAYLEVGPDAGATKGFLPPRLTTSERNNIPSPRNGLLIFNKSTVRFNYYDSTNATWNIVGVDSLGGNGMWFTSGNSLPPADYKFGTLNNRDINFYTNNVRRMTLKGSGLTIDNGDSVWILGVNPVTKDMVYSSRTSFISIDSLRRSGLNVEARKNGTWVTQFQDSIGSGGTGYNPQLKYGLRFHGNGDTVGYIYGGKYYRLDYEMYEPWSIQIIAKPAAGAQYVMGNEGGEHLGLFGFNGGTSTIAISGNCYSHYTPYSFVSWDLVKVDDCHSFGALYNYSDSSITTYIDCVPSTKQFMNVPRHVSAGSVADKLCVGTSGDHNPFKGTLFQFQLNEGSVPMTPNSFYWPGRTQISNQPGTTVLYDFRTPSFPIKDLGNGYFGRHDGEPHYLADDTRPLKDEYKKYLPYWVCDSCTKPHYTGSVTTDTSEMYDYFERDDETPFWPNSHNALGLPNIDSTQGGYGGRQGYVYDNYGTNYWAGILSTYCLFSLPNTIVNLDAGRPNQRIRVGLGAGTYSRNIVIQARKTDINNMVFVNLRDDGYIILWQLVAGTPTSLGSYIFGSGAINELELEVNGSTAKVYTDGTLRITGTISGVPSGNKFGFGVPITNPLAGFVRIKYFKYSRK